LYLAETLAGKWMIEGAADTKYSNEVDTAAADQILVLDSDALGLSSSIVLLLTCSSVPSPVQNGKFQRAYMIQPIMLWSAETSLSHLGGLAAARSDQASSLLEVRGYHGLPSQVAGLSKGPSNGHDASL
jgi:hypothetical protein